MVRALAIQRVNGRLAMLLQLSGSMGELSSVVLQDLHFAGQAIGEDGGFVSGHPNSQNGAHGRGLKIRKIMVFVFFKIDFEY